MAEATTAATAARIVIYILTLESFRGQSYLRMHHTTIDDRTAECMSEQLFAAKFGCFFCVSVLRDLLWRCWAASLSGVREFSSRKFQSKYFFCLSINALIISAHYIRIEYHFQIIEVLHYFLIYFTVLTDDWSSFSTFNYSKFISSVTFHAKRKSFILCVKNNLQSFKDHTCSLLPIYQIPLTFSFFLL